MASTAKGTVVDGRPAYRKRRRTLISCTECHRRKQKCDRDRPCQNCVKRCRPELCHYERHDGKICNTTAANASSASSSSSGETSIKTSTSGAHPESLSNTNQLSSQDHTHLVGILGYSTHNVHNTFGLANKVGPTSSSVSNPPTPADVFNRKQTALDEKYRSLVRQLPSKEYIDILVQQFFSDINWQYDVLDEIAFRQQLARWRRFPYLAHSQGVDSLPADVLTFPCLVFQVMAHSLIHQPPGEPATSILEPLKYASDMTFVDLATDFSEVGYSMLETMDKKNTSLVAVQSGILRASFLKNTGSVIEAWHVVGTTIRHAQEIGLHAVGAAPNPSLSIDDQWDHEMRRRVLFVLHNWDIHMAVVLGRPITTTTLAEIMDLPDDLAQRECGEPPRKRTEQDAPTPFGVIRVGYDIAYRYFPQVRELENHGARTENYISVRDTHAAILGNMDRIPLWCRHDDPDIRFDQLPGCHWLPAARQALTSGIYFVLLSLHRPYIFSVPESRAEALAAALMVFTAQKRLFHLSEPKQYLTFNMVFPLFDAIVISLAILVVFPDENGNLHSRLVENVCWGIDILAKIGQFNVMAQSASGVAKTLFSRLEEGHEYALQCSSHSSGRGEIESLDSRMADLRAAETSSNVGVTTDPVGASSLTETRTDLDVGNFFPPRPLGDLFYQDVDAPLSEDTHPANLPADFLQFDGDYSDDSFWSFMNNLNYV